MIGVNSINAFIVCETIYVNVDSYYKRFFYLTFTPMLSDDNIFILKVINFINVIHGNELSVQIQQYE